jgi:integrase
MCAKKVPNLGGELINMVSYRKRGNVWQFEISFKDANGNYRKLRKSGFRIKSEAISAASYVQVNNPKLTTYLRGQQSLLKYYQNWIKLYKENIVSDITYMKYVSTAKHISKLFGDTKLIDITKTMYQEKLNIFAKTHAKRTVSGLHKYIRACLLDALDENIIPTDPTRKAVITGKPSVENKKALNYNEWRKLISNINYLDPSEMMIYIAAVTGMRYAEVAGITRDAIDFSNQTISINKTWDYKYRTGFKKTKTAASVRIVTVDTNTISVLKQYLSFNSVDDFHPIFLVNHRILVSAQINQVLKSKLKELSLPAITFHALRHTHASVLLYKGVSVLSVSKRLGHSNVTTTQSTYLHIIKELEAQDQSQIIKIIGLVDH